MLTVYKYPLPDADEPVVTMPFGAMVLKVECQGGAPFIWALVDMGSRFRDVDYRFRRYGTGDPIDRDYEWSHELTHLATFQQGPFVWHLFGPRDLKYRDPEASDR